MKNFSEGAKFWIHLFFTATKPPLNKIWGFWQWYCWGYRMSGVWHCVLCGYQLFGWKECFHCQGPSSLTAHRHS